LLSLPEDADERDGKSRRRTGGTMSRLLATVGATVGGGVGWWLGGHIGLMTAFSLSVLGTAFGVYAGRRFADEYLNT
jgi:hypothetical protein